MLCRCLIHSVARPRDGRKKWCVHVSGSLFLDEAEMVFERLAVADRRRAQ